MIKYAELNEESKVINVVVASESSIASISGLFIKESDAAGEAVIGSTYDKDLNKFIKQQPYPSWTLNSLGEWKSPTDKPEDGKKYLWLEDSQEWEEIVLIDLPLEPIPPQI